MFDFEFDLVSIICATVLVAAIVALGFMIVVALPQVITGPNVENVLALVLTSGLVLAATWLLIVIIKN